jgi:hypothetical protein
VTQEMSENKNPIPRCPHGYAAALVQQQDGWFLPLGSSQCPPCEGLKIAPLYKPGELEKPAEAPVLQSATVPKSAPGLSGRLADMEAELTTLRSIAVGQQAQIAALVGLLAKGRKLTREEAMLVAVAGKDAQAHRGLTAEQVRQWTAEVIAKSFGGPTAQEQKAQPPST